MSNYITGSMLWKLYGQVQTSSPKWFQCLSQRFMGAAMETGMHGGLSRWWRHIFQYLVIARRAALSRVVGLPPAIPGPWGGDAIHWVHLVIPEAWVWCVRPMVKGMRHQSPKEQDGVPRGKAVQANYLRLLYLGISRCSPNHISFIIEKY